VLEHGGAVSHLDVLDKLDAVMRPAQQARERRLARLQRLPAQIGAIKLKQIEADKLHLAVMTERAQPVEVSRGSPFNCTQALGARIDARNQW